jgi:hypothetical protein
MRRRGVGSRRGGRSFVDDGVFLSWMRRARVLLHELGQSEGLSTLAPAPVSGDKWGFSRCKIPGASESWAYPHWTTPLALVWSLNSIPSQQSHAIAVYLHVPVENPVDELILVRDRVSCS